MSFSKITLIILIVSVCAEDYNYQDRYIYKSEFLNACSGGAKDFLDLQVTFDDRSPLRTTIKGQTECQDFQPLKILEIIPATMAYYSSSELNEEIIFKQEAIYKKIEGIIYAIVQRLSVNRSTFNDEAYDCVVQGDGTIRDFGPYESIPAPKIYIHCKKSEIQSII